MAGKQYEVAYPFDRTDPRTGETAHYEVGATYAGQDVEDYLDGRKYGTQGPLIREKSASAPADAPKEK